MGIGIKPDALSGYLPNPAPASIDLPKNRAVAVRHLAVSPKNGAVSESIVNTDALAFKPRTLTERAAFTHGHRPGQPNFLDQASWEQTQADALKIPVHPSDVAHMRYSVALMERFRREAPIDIIRSILDSYRDQTAPDWQTHTNTVTGSSNPVNWAQVRDQQLAFAKQYADNQPSPHSRLKIGKDVEGQARQALQADIDGLHRNPAGAALMKLVDALPFDIEYRPGTETQRLITQLDRVVRVGLAGIQVDRVNDRLIVYGPQPGQTMPKNKSIDGADLEFDRIAFLAHELADALKVDELNNKLVFQLAHLKGGQLKDRRAEVAFMERGIQLHKDLHMHFEAKSIEIENLVRYWSHFTIGAQPMALRFPIYDHADTFPWRKQSSP
ncbi:MAG TPA: hypothetical protein PLQ67_08170 [Burkholderiaceae bacterium]|nr:hypothetical protein [Burkholderiaceae bacterium]